MQTAKQDRIKLKLQSVFDRYPADVVEAAMARIGDLQKGRQQIDERQKRRKESLADLTVFIRNYFSHYFYCEFGPQQLELIRDIGRFRGKPSREPLRMLRALSRGFGKSTLMSLIGVLWLCLRKDWKFVVMVSSTKDNADGFLRKIIEESEDNQKLIEDFPEVLPAIDQKGQFVSWKDSDIVCRGGFRMISKGILNSIRGARHKQYRPDALIVDDPDEEKDVISESIMTRKYRWLDRAALRLGDAWGIDVMFAYTTLSPNCMGEIVYTDRKYADWDKKKFKAIEIDSNGKEYSTWEAGAPLRKLLIERDGDPSIGKEGDPVTFARERQNEILAEIDQRFKGLVRTYTFNRQEIQTWRKVLTVDLSLGKTETSDLSAIIGTAVSPSGKYREIYSDIQRRRPNQIVDDLITALLLYPDWEICGIESNGNQEHFLDTFRMLLENHNRQNPGKMISVPIIPINNTGDKIQRITGTLQPMFSGGLLEIRDDSTLLYKQTDEFPYHKKDGPDALEMGVSYLKNNQVSVSYANNDLDLEKESRRLNDAYRIQAERHSRFTGR